MLSSKTFFAILLFCTIASSIASVFINAEVHGGNDYVADEEDGEVFEVVGARIVTCAGCRLNSLPKVRGFIENEAASYPALYVEYVHSKDPELHFLDKHRRVVSTHDLSPLSGLQIVQLLNNNNIHTWTPEPKYEAPEFHETEYCVAFRQTAQCNPLGPREPQFDSPCLSFIEESRSGICQCKKGQPDVELACGHEADTCDSFCTPDGALKGDEHSASHSIPPVPEPNDDL